MAYSVFRIVYKKAVAFLESIPYTLYPIRPASSRGITTLLAVGFMGVLMLIIGTLASYVFQQSRYGRALVAREQALNVAEAGLEYYKWRLTHDAQSGGTMTTTGAGLSSLPGSYTVSDPEGGTVGSAEITATPALQCGRVQWIDVVSKGTANADTAFPRTLLARYMRPSVSEYSNVLNANVWAGADRQITGPYHNNQGIRMDGTNNSSVTSGVPTWQCDSSFGCSPTQTKPGIFGSGPNSALWKYPVSSINFDGMLTDLSALEAYALTAGIYLSGTAVYVGGVQQGGTHTAVNANDQRGYHLVFNGNGTVSVYRVGGTSGTWVLHVPEPNGPWYFDYFDISLPSQTLLGTYAIPSGCSIVYSRAKTWVEGTVSGKVTLIAADSNTYAPDILLQGNIGYQTTDGTTGFTAVAEDSVLFARVVPDVMTIRGTFVAKDGYYGRDLFDCDEAPYDRRTSLTLNGTVVSKKRVGTKWTYGWCSGTSGFLTRYDNYDRLQAFDPPPFTPSVSTDYRYNLWREQ